MKKERPILFSTLMVQAILEGRKTQTRRVIKPQPEIELKSGNTCNYIFKKGGMFAGGVNVNLKELADNFLGLGDFCPYGEPGYLLWVRETWTKVSVPNGTTARTIETVFKADNPSGLLSPDKWKPSIHMPKAAARIWLKIKDVRVERLHEISEEDAKAEGIELLGKHVFIVDTYYKNYDTNDEEIGWLSPINSFDSLWCKINGEKSWDANPWVWVVEFEVLSTTGKPETLNSEL